MRITDEMILDICKHTNLEKYSEFDKELILYTAVGKGALPVEDLISLIKYYKPNFVFNKMDTFEGLKSDLEYLFGDPGRVTSIIFIGWCKVYLYLGLLSDDEYVLFADTLLNYCKHDDNLLQLLIYSKKIEEPMSVNVKHIGKLIVNAGYVPVLDDLTVNFKLVQNPSNTSYNTYILIHSKIDNSIRMKQLKC